jgi:hypothetical protein
VWALLVCWVILSLAGGQVIGSLISEGSSVRDHHRWQQEQALQRQLRELERQIWKESLPDWRREAEIKCEARRRLGLPEEEA